MKKLMALCLAMMVLLVGCSLGGVSQEEYDKVIAENNTLSNLSGFKNITIESSETPELDSKIIVQGTISNVEFRETSAAIKPMLDEVYGVDVGRSIDLAVTGIDGKMYRMGLSCENLIGEGIADFLNGKSVTVIGTYSNVGEGSYESITIEVILCDGLVFSSKQLVDPDETLELIRAKQN